MEISQQQERGHGKNDHKDGLRLWTAARHEISGSSGEW
jgi:hypothetical protein